MVLTCFLLYAKLFSSLIRIMAVGEELTLWRQNSNCCFLWKITSFLFFDSSIPFLKRKSEGKKRCVFEDSIINFLRNCLHFILRAKNEGVQLKAADNLCLSVLRGFFSDSSTDSESRIAFHSVPSSYFGNSSIFYKSWNGSTNKDIRVWNAFSIVRFTCKQVILRWSLYPFIDYLLPQMRVLLISLWWLPYCILYWEILGFSLDYTKLLRKDINF